MALRRVHRPRRRHAREVVHVPGRSGRRPRGHDRRGPRRPGALHALQEGFKEEHGLQCGFCTPGMMPTASALLAENPDPSAEEIRWALSGNICRCTGYQNIVKAVQWAARTGGGGARWRPETRRAGSAAVSSGGRTTASSSAAATTSTTLCCPGCCTWRSCAVRSPTRRSPRSTHRRRRAHPGVVAVVTGASWRSTTSPGRRRSGDTQAVLATDKVRMQGQEVASRHRRGSVHGPRRARADRGRLRAAPGDHDAPGRPRARRAADPRRQGGQTDNSVYHREAGDAEGTERAFAEADRVVSLETLYPRSHPAPLECCGCIADVNPATGKTTIYMTSQAPHAHRTVFALVAGLAEHQIQIISPDIGGGFGNKVPVHPGYVVATAASLLIGRPVKWIEDRTGNLISTGFARDFHMQGEPRAHGRGEDDGDPRPAAVRPGLRVPRRAADEVQGRSVPHRHRLVRHPHGARDGRRRVHEQGARRCRLPLLVPRDGGVVLRRAPCPDGGVLVRDRSGGAAASELHPARPVPVHVGDRLSSTTQGRREWR